MAHGGVAVESSWRWVSFEDPAEYLLNELAKPRNVTFCPRIELKRPDPVAWKEGLIRRVEDIASAREARARSTEQSHGSVLVYLTEETEDFRGIACAAAAASREDGILLEIGCSTGNLPKDLGKLGLLRDYVGCDASLGNTRECDEKYGSEKVHFRRWNVLEYRMEDTFVPKESLANLLCTEAGKVPRVKLIFMDIGGDRNALVVLEALERLRYELQEMTSSCDANWMPAAVILKSKYLNEVLKRRARHFLGSCKAQEHTKINPKDVSIKQSYAARWARAMNGGGFDGTQLFLQVIQDDADVVRSQRQRLTKDKSQKQIKSEKHGYHDADNGSGAITHENIDSAFLLSASV